LISRISAQSSILGKSGPELLFGVEPLLHLELFQGEFLSHFLRAEQQPLRHAASQHRLVDQRTLELMLTVVRAGVMLRLACLLPVSTAVESGSSVSRRFVTAAGCTVVSSGPRIPEHGKPTPVHPWIHRKARVGLPIWHPVSVPKAFVHHSSLICLATWEIKPF
jgi:hypothetical protein